MMELLKVGFLFGSVFFTLVGIVRAKYEQKFSPQQFIAWAACVTGFVYMQWL